MVSRLSTTTNPTNLKEISKKDVGLQIVEIAAEKSFQLCRLDLADYKLDGDFKVIVLAHAGNTSRRYEVGTVSTWSADAFSLQGLDLSRVLRFRLLIRMEGSAQIVASAENLRPAGDGEIESLLPIVVAELGQRVWRVAIDDDGAVLQCNSRIFPSGASAENFIPFRALVLPEALRQILLHISKDPARLTTEGSCWEDWMHWMQLLQIEMPPDDEELRSQWIEESTARFCDRFRPSDDLQAFLQLGENA